MRVTTVIGGLHGGGAERVCVNLANAWVGRGREVTLLTISHPYPAAYEVDPRVERRDVGWPRPPRENELSSDSIAPIIRGLARADCLDLIPQIALLSMMRDAIVATRPDVVVSHLDMTNIRVLAALHETHIPVIACEHTDPRLVSIGEWNRFREALYPHARAVVAPHEATARHFSRFCPSFPIPNPLVPPPPHNGAASNGARKRLVMTTRMSPEKRVDMVVRAFASIEGEHPDWDLEIFGDGPMYGSVAQLVRELSPDGRIALRGFTKEPYAALAGADLFVSASWVEGFGNCIWEALASGVPVVAMECGASVNTLVRHGIDGVIVHGGTAGHLAGALSALMHDDATRRAYASRAGEAATRFSMEESLRMWDGVFGDPL